ncbi:Os07g0517433, partial [Oryza sativa Japonica Group]
MTSTSSHASLLMWLPILSVTSSRLHTSLRESLNEAAMAGVIVFLLGPGPPRSSPPRCRFGLRPRARSPSTASRLP